MNQIRLTKGLKLKTLKTVRIIDNCYNEPSAGALSAHTIVEVTDGPTRLSHVGFKVLKGGGTINRRMRDYKGWPIEKMQNITPEKNSHGFFFSQGHKTSHPYDFGTLSTEYFEVINES